MARFSHALRRMARLVRRDQRGSASIEFVILVPAIMTLFMMSIEVGMMMTRGLMLDRGIDIAMRELRLGNLSPMTHDQLKSEICKNSLIIPDCENSISVELMPINATGWTPAITRPTCYDKAEPVKPALQFTPGGANEVMIVSACVTFKPFFPTTGLAATIKLQNSGEYAMIATSAYVNEP